MSPTPHSPALASLIDLEELNLNGDCIIGPGLAHLQGLTKLRKLSIAGGLTKMLLRDEGMKPLQAFVNLEQLYLGGQPRITDVGLECIKGLTKLRKLDLSTGVKLRTGASNLSKD